MPHTEGNATRSQSAERGLPDARELLEPGSVAFLAVLAAVRIAVPLAALAASGSQLPGFPRFDYVATTGDSGGFYAATREFLASWGRLPIPVLLTLVVATLAGAGALVWAWRGRKLAREWLLVLGATGFCLLVTVAVTQMHPPGAAVFGWPLIWALPMLPYRALGFPLDPDIAFGFGLALSLLANVVTLVAIAIAGLYVTRRRSLGLAAASLFAFWPYLVGLLGGGARAWENGTWTVDVGLVMYTEPLSTALVTTALALLLSPRLTPVRGAAAGVALSLATAVKLSNGLVGGVVLVLLAVRLGRRGVMPYLAGLLSFAPLIAVYWPKGYETLRDTPGYWPDRPFSVEYVFRTWTESFLFRPSALIVLVPLAVVGVAALRQWWPRVLLVAWVLVNAVFYSLYWVTPQHPRFLFASLPAVFVLWILGAWSVIQLVRAQLAGGRYTFQSPSSTGR